MTVQESTVTQRDDANWLVKSGDRVLGPFTREQIKNMLYEKELVVIDEVTTPLGRWRYIRDEAVFALVVEEVRKSHLSTREDTELGASHDGTSVTDTGGTPTDFVSKPTQVVRDATVVRKSEPTQEERAAVNANRVPPPQAQTTRSYGSNSDRRVQESVGRTKRLIWLAAIVILAGAGILLFRLQTPPPTNHTLGLDHLAAKAALARSLGDFRGAVGAYEQLSDAGKLPLEMQIDHAVLRSRLRDDANPASRILDSVSQQGLSGTTLAQFETARGLASLSDSRNSDQIKAAASHFAKAVTADRSFAPAAFNSAVTSYLASLYEPTDLKTTARIANEFTRIAEMPALDVSGRIAAKLFSVLVRLKSNDPAMTINATEDLSRVQKGIVQFWQESALLGAYAKLKLGQSAQAARDFRIMMGGDPFVTDEHLSDPYLYIAPLTWPGLKPICEELHEATMRAGVQANRKQDITIETMLQFCRYKAGDRTDEARERIKELELKSVADPLIRSISAFMLMKLSPDQARAKLADASDSVSWELGRILRGRLCNPDDLECLNQAFRATAMLRTSIFFKVGSARYSYQQAAQLKEQGNDTEANAQMQIGREILDSVREISPNYIPLLMVEANQDK